MAAGIVAAAVDLAIGFTTAPTSIPDNSGGAFLNGVKATTNPPAVTQDSNQQSSSQSSSDQSTPGVCR